MKNLWLMLALVALFGVGLAGCASSEAEPECTVNHDCSFGEQCNTNLGVCEEAIRNGNNTTNNGTTDTGPNNGGLDTNPNNGTPDTGTNNSTPDTDTPDTGGGCSPACGAGMHCENGACVDDPTATCTQNGESCDPELGDQGSFWCVQDADGDGQCLPKCDEPFSATGCGVSEYCWDLGSEAQSVPACISSDCQVDSDCDSGTCLNFDNQFGVCLGSGAKTEGASCDPAAASECQAGLICREEPQDSGQGVCRSLCDLWAVDSGCPTGQLCSLFTAREGICRTEATATGTSPFDSCSPSPNMCADSTPCVAFSSDNFCLQVCRPGMGDCAGVGAGPAVCHNYLISGERAWGFCMPRCDFAEDCCSGTSCPDSACQAGMCRNRCTPGNEVQDCCGGSTPCESTCVNGLCE